uniref:UDP-N-acetylglucosamine 1-carboxyvinyltransferase n=1 Tax=Phenylobacterium glaciei TaxID=2803784 RepID=A0A974S9E3_9CAUL|nr:hypothetical protein JKL49_21305 [Phenylobacterium glaciei]
MRSTLMLIPALLYRFGAASIEEDVTGCTLGVREIDPHIEVFESFGADIDRKPEAIFIKTPKGFATTDHWLDYASVTTTENFILCAATAKGRSQITNAACEPHVQEFCSFLTMMGARLEGVGGSRVIVEGVNSLSGAEFTFADDFHEVATFLAMGAMTGGDIAVKNGSVDQFPCWTAPSPSSAWRSPTRTAGAAPRSTPAACGCASPSPPTSCRRWRPRPGPMCRPTCCRSSWRWACAPRASACSGTRSMRARSAGPRNWASSAPTPCCATRTA